MEQINNSNCCCTACAYWLGYRKPNRLGFVEVESRMDHDLAERYSRLATYCCSNYCGWSSLR